jgi:2-polyprenyl-3-methyl-5-hydroxy-6-metoxy-1,4-benzoquinol methylase
MVMTREHHVRELLDGPLPASDLRATLDDLDRLNAWFGGYSLTLTRIRRVARRLPPGQRLVVVDVGGGRGDLAVRIVRWARRAGRPVQVIVLDRDPTMLELARRRTARYPEIALVCADATALPLRPAGAHVVVAALTIHHLTPEEATAALAAMAAAAPVVVVNDLLRTPASLALVWLATRVLRLHPVSCHDGPVSVRRAYSADELTALGRGIGRGVRVSSYPWLGRLVAEVA